MPSVPGVIRLIDPADDRDMRAVFDVGIAAKTFDLPWFSPINFSSWLIQMRTPDPEDAQELYAYFDADGTCLGTNLLFIPLEDNTDKVYSLVDVAPEHRRKGVGSALVEHGLARARALGRTKVFAETLVPGAFDEQHGFVRFARSSGFSQGWDDIARHLALPVPQERLSRLAQSAAVRYVGDYRIETFAGRVPEVHLPGLAELMRLLAVDSPSGDIDFDAEAVSPDRLRRMYDREEEQGRIHLSALAVHDESGAVVAQSDLTMEPPIDFAVQLGTYVHREHRGHRLGMAVKVANLQQLQRDHPGPAFVRTMNAETNVHMVSVNVDLGFEIVETSTEWVMDPTTR
ncbi:GNAT family N-acetyltransferase [Flexivirga endophytica]|uniref:GNAT family N-acetyltransferase n=1 Tax=Flexivirga endophytica TaxID=1849103 RepID=A0A916T2L5_9MICO|nr:GNAT family N-acetyltransferase [Flexivirga endophytica]GHB50568.1 GNAT family N-acetyltransferase [Flexivirga endophytica]